MNDRGLPPDIEAQYAELERAGNMALDHQFRVLEGTLAAGSIVLAQQAQMAAQGVLPKDFQP